MAEEFPAFALENSELLGNSSPEALQPEHLVCDLGFQNAFLADSGESMQHSRR
jgi:hypothetical protein